MATTTVSGTTAARCPARTGPGVRRGPFVVGMASATIVGVAAVGVGGNVPIAARAAISIAFAVAAAAARVDRIRLRLPNGMVLGVLTFGVIAGLTADALPAVLTGSAIATAPFLAMHLIEPRSLGFGDVKYAAACGGAIGALSVLAAPIMVCLTLSATMVNRILHPSEARPLGPIIFVGTIAAAIAIVALQQQGVLL